MSGLSAVIVNYGTAGLLPGLLETLAREPAIAETLVVDNSGDVEADRLSGSVDIRVIGGARNRGFARAANEGISLSRTDHVLLLNVDVRLAPGAVTALLDAHQSYRSPIVGPRYYWDDDFRFRLPPATGTSMSMDLAGHCAAGYALDAALLGFSWTVHHDRFWNAKAPFAEPFLSGACLLLDKAGLASAGLAPFDERFFLYFEDTDLCARALAKGILPICVPAARVVHYYNQSPEPDEGKGALMESSRAIFMAKHYGDVTFSRPTLGFTGPPVTDLGELKSAPWFDAPGTESPEMTYFEIGTDPLFVPFAQADATSDGFQFPASVWDRLAPGTYFTRMRRPISGTEQIWKWNKS